MNNEMQHYIDSDSFIHGIRSRRTIGVSLLEYHLAETRINLNLAKLPLSAVLGSALFSI